MKGPCCAYLRRKCCDRLVKTDPVKKIRGRKFRPILGQDFSCIHALNYRNRLGYTGFKEPMADEAALAAYAQACDEGRWTIHAAAHITAFSPLTGGVVSMDKLNGLRRRSALPVARTGTRVYATKSLIRPLLATIICRDLPNWMPSARSRPNCGCLTPRHPRKRPF